jgi:hypothetical protein
MAKAGAHRPQKKAPRTADRQADRAPREKQKAREKFSELKSFGTLKSFRIEP